VVRGGEVVSLLRVGWRAVGGGRCCGYGDEGVAAEGIGKGAGRRD